VLEIRSAIGPARLRQTEAGLRIVIPTHLSWYGFVSLPISAVIGFALVHQLDGIPHWLMIGLWAMCMVPLAKWMWGVVGRQIVVVNRVALTVRYDLAGLGWRRSYLVNRISKLAYSRIVTTGDVQRGLENCPSYGRICFEYGSVMQWWIGRFHEADALELIRVLENRAGAPFTSLNFTPDRPLPTGVIAEEVHRGAGGLLLFGMLAGVIYDLTMFSDNIPLRIASGCASLASIIVGIAAQTGYQYKFTPAGLGIYTLGIRLRFIPVEQIARYEKASWNYGDRYNFGIFSKRRCYFWGGFGVRIYTTDGQVFLGHQWPEKIIAHLDAMKGLPSQTQRATPAAVMTSGLKTAGPISHG